MRSPRNGVELPNGLRIGERFLLSFDDPELVEAPQLGRLQDLSKDGALCIDVSPELRPPRGTPVTISSLRKNPSEYRFSSEILGRGRLNGRLPVLLVKAPERIERRQRRTSFRISAAIKARVEWKEEGKSVSRPAVVVDLSGGGARIFVRQRPSVEESLSLFLQVPDPFIEEWALRKLSRTGIRPLSATLFPEAFRRTCAELRASFDAIATRIVLAREQNEKGREPIQMLSVAFHAPHEGCYRLVRYLERQAAQKGAPPAREVATAA